MRELIVSNERSWWHKFTDSHEPMIYSSLSDADHANLQKWYDRTEYPCECQVPFMSIVLSLIDGNKFGGIVQLGHWLGYSTVLLAMHMKRLGIKNSFVSTDISIEGCNVTHKFLSDFDLTDYAKICNMNSVSDEFTSIAKEFLPKINMVIIDSSHQYEMTLQELNLYYDLVEKGGFIILHDSSVYAQEWDSTKSGGVLRAINEFKKIKPDLNCININGSLDNNLSTSLQYLDSCGICIIQK